jgi:hypothetical protein
VGVVFKAEISLPSLSIPLSSPQTQSFLSFATESQSKRVFKKSKRLRKVLIIDNRHLTFQIF